MTNPDNGLKFNSLQIDRGSYGSDKGKLRCRVKCERWDTQLDVKVPDDVVLEIMKLIAPAISASVHASLLDVARDHEDWMIGNDMAQQAKQIEDGTGEGQIA